MLNAQNSYKGMHTIIAHKLVTTHNSIATYLCINHTNSYKFQQNQLATYVKVMQILLCFRKVWGYW